MRTIASAGGACACGSTSAPTCGNADWMKPAARPLLASVERQLIAMDPALISEGLVRGLVDSELLRDLLDALRGRRLLSVTVAQVESAIKDHGSSDSLAQWAGREILRQFALGDVFSPDIVQLNAAGRLVVFDVEVPCDLAASSLDAAAVAAPAHNVETFLHEFQLELERMGQCVQRPSPSIRSTA